MHTGIVVHVSENLGTTNPDPIDTCEDGILDVFGFETCRKVGCESDGVSFVHEFQGLARLELFRERLTR